MTRNNIYKIFIPLLLLMLFGSTNAWAQTDYSGVYYIGSNGYNASTPESNYYLCPTEGWIYYKATDDWDTDGTTYPNPYLTTYKCKTNAYHSGDASDAVWIIEKASNQNYYYIKHRSTGKYMVSNGQISGTTNANRMRVHLETVVQADLDDKELFSIEQYSTYLVISPKSSAGWNGNYKWYTVNGGNQNKLVGNGSNGGPGDYTATGGILGVYTQSDANAKFYLETISPTIGYNSSGQVVISHPSATTLYYTLDGSNPTTSSTLYTGPISLTAGITTVKAIAVYPSNAASSPTTFQAFNMDGSHSFLIQSKEFDYYYMIPNLSTETANDSQDRLTTNSLARPSMQWYFEDAGMDNGVQYYYIKNLATGNPQYIYYLSDNTIRWKDGKVTTEEITDDAYKFSFVESTYGGYTIRPKLKQTYWLRKGGGCKSNNHIAASNSNADQGYTRWSFISYNGSVPNTAAPITASVGDNKQYYKIASEAEPTYFIVTPTSPATVVTTTTTESESTIWYFEEATHDDWLTYYYIRNAKSNEYLYLKQTGSNALEMKVTPTNDGKCYFAIAKSATDGLYIVPQSLKYNGARVYFSLYKKSGESNVRTGSARWYNDNAGNDNIIKWIFTETTLRCTRPVIAYSESANGYIITGANNTGEKIYYTTNGEDPTISSSLEYNGPILMSSLSAGTVIKAIVARNEDATTMSEIASVTIEKVETPVIQDNGNNAIEITCATPGVTIHYTTDGTTPTSASAAYSTPLTDVSGKVIKAIAVKGGFIDSEVATSGTIMFACATPVIKKNDQNSFTITCSNPTTGVTIYYTTDGTTPTTSSSHISSGGVVTGVTFPLTIKAMATADGYTNSAIAEKSIGLGLNGTGTVADPYEIDSDSDFDTFVGMVNDNGTTNSDYAGCAAAHYKLTSNVSASGSNPIVTAFTGVFNGDLRTIRGLGHALFNSVNGGTVKNVILDNVGISSGTNVGAICNEASGATRIYNCGVLATTSSSVSGSGHVGSIVGSISGNTRVINCYSFANVNGGSYTAGIVGYNPVGTTQANVETAGMVMNCMFYGDITGSNISPVYGGELIDNAGETGVNNYNYYRRNRYDRETDTYVDDVSFDNNLSLDSYHRSWPADAKYLTRFEYYRSILNSNKKLCTWWVKGTNGTAPTDDDIEEVGIAKWVLDPSIAPYPILKKWGKYPSVINQDPDQRIASSTQTWVNRANASDHWGKEMAPDTEGQKLGTVSVTINGGDYYTGSGSGSKSIPITAMDTDNKDYCYGKIQLPYYNEIFGNPDGDTWEAKYGGNYTAKVVTGWDISGGSAATDYNFADRNSYSGRVYAQGGYFYVPKGVTSITITAHWADAVYLCNKDYSVDRVNVATGKSETQNSTAAKTAKYGSAFTPAGTISNKFHGQDVYTTIQDAISHLSNVGAGKDVYNQAIVLIGNVQVRNHSYVVNLTGNNSKPFTLMSADLDFDNEPDNCLELQFRNDIDRPGVQPIRFDFLPVPELGLAIRTNNKAYAIGIMIPLGHFEITETAFMHTTQFEYDANVTRSGKSPVIINGGEHEMFTKRKQAGSGQRDRTSYFLLGGNAWIHRFAPGAHPNTGDKPDIYLFPVNVIGGQIKELYLTGLYRPELPTGGSVINGAPRCYIDGGKFDVIAGAGYDKVSPGEDVIFKINHSLIGEFYGGGINASNPVSGNIDVTINNSKVDKYCGGPKVGVMTAGKTVKTDAKGTTFGVFYGGGNGGNSYYRQLQRDGDFASSNIGNWTTAPDNKDPYNFDKFNPLNLFTEGTAIAVHDEVSTTNKGYHAEYEFEVFNQSNGLEEQITQRGFINWIQFGITSTGNVNSTLENCKVLGNFYGGGNLASVSGDVTSTLTNTKVDGSVFGAGYSAAIPTFQVHDKANKVFPSINDAGVITEGSILYVSTVYEWTNEKAEGKTEAQMKANPTYSKEVNGETKWYCYTWNPLENLGAVTGNVSLTIDGNAVAGEDGKVMTVGESVYGGGEESGVDGNTEVKVTGGTIGTAGKGGAEYGNVYGGGKGKEDDKLAGLVKGNANVTISGMPTILHNIYGGGAYGSVGEFTYDATSGLPTARKENTTGGACTVTIKGGTIGSNGNENGMVFGSSRGDVAAPGDDGVDPNDRLAWVYSTHVTIGDTSAETTPTIKGSVYGSGENGHTFQNTIVDIKKGTIGIPTGDAIGEYSGAQYPSRGNVYGGGCGTDTYSVTENVGTENEVTHTYYNPLAGIVRGTATVNITGGQVVHNVYGAGAMGSVGNAADATSGKTTVNISGGRIGYDGNRNGNVFGAARGEYGISTATSGLANVRESEVNINYATTPAADNEGKTEQLITGSVFGGGESGLVKGSVAVKMTGGLLLKDIYGGGALADTQTSNWDASVNSGAGGWATGKTSASATTTVRLTGGTIVGEAYGGGLGEAGKPAYVYGDVLLDLNGTTTSGETGTAIASDARGCVVHEVFGCNNANGTPMGQVLVHVYATQHAGKSQIANAGDVTNAKTKGDYDVKAVYGGGNLAAYEPYGGKNTTYSTNVIIDGCGLTSIQQVYGGGNAASTPATNVTVNGTCEIEELFGGGNGKDKITVNGVEKDNPGANVGFRDYSEVENDERCDTKEKRQTSEWFNNNYVYGTGKAAVNVFGGTIHRVFGGSNTKGNVRQTAVTMLEDAGGCDFCVDEAYGGGKSAPMDAEAKLLMACIPGLSAAYGGAEAADIQGNVTLNITNGTFDRVFGGNNKSGTIQGSITVNIEEVGCRPIIIGELYGGGNQASYSVYGYKQVTEGEGDETVTRWIAIEDANDPEALTGDNVYANPQVNVKSFTSIGNIYGGGFGSGATMVANPTVNVNVAYGRYYNNDVSVVGNNAETPNHYPIPSHAKGKMGAINNIFGGGNAAKVIGNTTLNIATLEEVYVVKEVTVGTDLPDGCYTRDNDGKYTIVTGTAQEGTTYYEKKDVQGVDIRGNVFGGGNQAEVTGDAKVQIGKKNEGE